MVYASSVAQNYLLDIQGIRDYKMVSAIKEKFKIALPAESVLFERKVSRGRLALALKTDLPVEELRNIVIGISLSPGKLAITHESGETLEISVIPEVQ